MLVRTLTPTVNSEGIPIRPSKKMDDELTHKVRPCPFQVSYDSSF